MKGKEEESRREGQGELKRAYLLTTYGHYEAAMQACDRAREFLGDDPLPGALKGAILSASGRPKEAIRELNGVCRRHREAILPALYLAEACFLAGRMRRGWKVLREINPAALKESPWAEFAAELEQGWEGLERGPEILEVSLSEEG